MASIQRTPSSTWQVRYKDPATGQHRAKTFKRKVEATRFLHTVEHSILVGSYITEERGLDSVATWVRQHTGERADLADSTRERSLSIVSKHVEPKWAATAIKDLGHRDVQQWVGELSGDLGPRTVRKVVGVVSSAMDAAVRDRRILSNPCTGVSYPPVRPSRHVYLTQAQVEQMVNLVRDRERLIVLILAYCGLRWGELAGLRVGDVDLDRQRLNIEQTIVIVKSRLVTKPPKTYQRRSVPMPRFLAEMVADASEGRGPDDLLVTSTEGAPLRNRNERRDWFNASAAGVGEPGLTPHGMRHTAASLAISAGASVLAVQRMLGHRSATVTLDVYADLFDDDLDELADRLDRLRSEARLRDSYAERADLMAL